MDTIRTPSDAGHRLRRRHSPEFKADVVAACCKPGVSMASVALANGVDANLVRRWVVAAEGSIDRTVTRLPDSTRKTLNVPPSFVPLQLPASAPSPAPAPSTPAAIHIELIRGPMKVVVTWPVTVACDCAAWLRELLR